MLFRSPGVPENTFVTCLLASEYDANTVYAAFDGRKNSDFKPYLLKSTDKGETWSSISSNLPDNGTVYVILEDFKEPNLLFAGTEFGAFFSNDGGQNWVKLSGLPTIPVKDMCIQKRENDLCLATFGRGFYILDDYSALRDLKPGVLSKEAHVFPIKTALSYIQSGGLYGQGEVYFRSNNPGPKAVFTYYLKKSISTLKQKRKKKEAEAAKKKTDITYPSREVLMAEDKEEAPYLVFTVLDNQGKVVRRIQTGAKKGIHRATWDLHYMSQAPPRQSSSRYRSGGGRGPAVPPGSYSVILYKSVNGNLTQLDGPVSFEVKSLDNSALKVKDANTRAAFDLKAQKLSAKIQVAGRLANEASAKIKTIRQSLKNAVTGTEDLDKKAKMINEELFDILTKLNGSPIRTTRVENHPPTMSGRIGFALRAGSRSTYGPTKAQEEQYEIAAKQFDPILQQLNGILNEQIPAFEKELDVNGIPWTPGRKISMKQ